MNSILIIFAIVIAVAIGYKTGLNTGFFAMVFAYFIGCFLLDMSPNEVISGWPLNTMFVILSTSLFYSFAVLNGTLEKAAGNLLYSLRNFPRLIPLALYFASAVIAALGAGFFTVLAFMAPLGLMICRESKTNPLVGAMAINCGALSGANFMSSGSGVIFRGLMTDVGMGPEAFTNSAYIFFGSVLYSILLILALTIITSRASTKESGTFSKPEGFTRVQKQTLNLIISMVVIVLIFPILETILPENKIIAFIASKVNIGLIAIVFSVIALLMKLAPQKEAIEDIPWSTIIMISGVGMLINVAIEAGTIEMLAQILGQNIPVHFILIAFSIIGAIMSFFSSTLGVVTPALFPIVPSIAMTTGISPVAIFASIVIGAQSSAISPFSSGGSLILGSIHDEKERQEMFQKLLFVAVPINVISATIFSYIYALMIG